VSQDQGFDGVHCGPVQAIPAFQVAGNLPTLIGTGTVRIFRPPVDDDAETWKIDGHDMPLFG
jgi:hypothetical protein